MFDLGVACLTTSSVQDRETMQDVLAHGGPEPGVAGPGARASSASMTKYPREAVDEVPPKPCSASSTALGGGRVDNRNGLARQRHRDQAIR